MLIRSASRALHSNGRFVPIRCLSTPAATTSQQSTHQNIFDRSAKRLQKERAAKHPDVALFDYIKDEVGFRLSDRLFDVKREFNQAVDLGCNRGFVSRHIMADTVRHLHLVDISPTMLQQATGTPGLPVTRHEMDEERFEGFADDSLDLVVSSLSLHWVNDLPGCFTRIRRALRPDGVFIGALYGGETLFELRSALQLAEVERRGGLAPHVSPFTQIRDIGGLLNRAGFTMLTIDTDELVVGYPSMFELMTDLKGMGESNAAFNRPLHLGRDTMLAASAIYRDLYGRTDAEQGDGVSATFQIIYFVGWKPGAGQAEPLAPGSGTVSLKQLSKIIENDGNVAGGCKKT